MYWHEQDIVHVMPLRREHKSVAGAAHHWRQHRDRWHVGDSALQGGHCGQTVADKRDTCSVSLPCGCVDDVTVRQTEQTSSHSPTMYR